MEQKFHLFVRRHAGIGYSVGVLSHPFIASFSDDVDTARADIARVLGRLLTRNERGIAQTTTSWTELRLRRIDLVVRAVQHHRLLPVPMKFTVLTHPLHERSGPRTRNTGPLVLHVPRLGLVETLAEPKDLEGFVEELIRHRLYMAPLAQLLDVAYQGEETVETLIVPYRPRVEAVKKAIVRAQPVARPMPSTLGESSRRLNDDVAHDGLERAFERGALLEALAEALTARVRASVLLVGDRGVGKTTLVHELVHRAERGEGVPAALRGIEVYSTSGARIIAGMRYLGEWQLRVQQMLMELRSRRAVLHIENLAELLATGSSEDGLDVARFLQPAIEAGDVTVILEAAPDDLARAERTHPALVHAMRAIQVPALDGSEARAALTRVAGRIGRTRHARFTDDALTRALDLTERFGTGALPGSAVQLLRAAAQPDGEATDRRTIRTLGPDDITRAFVRRTGYPRELIDPAVALDPDAVLATLRERVVGQDAAMELLRDLVVTLKTALTDPARPLGSFLLLGPTGVGKTESALALAQYLFGDAGRLARFDMSEYAAPGSGTRLVSDWGGREGALARRVREQPFGIVLLDEIEKADPSVHDLLLQILGEGRLTDATGRTVSFRNTIVMLTSNLGAETVARSLGFSGDAPHARDLHAHYVAAAAAFFRPELLNRFDHVVPYRPLSPTTIAHIARRALQRALEREGFARRGVRVRFDDAVVARLAALGFDPRHGARPLHRAIEHHVIAPLARMLAARGGDAPDTLDLVVRDDALRVTTASSPDTLTLDAAALRTELLRRAATMPPVALALVALDSRAHRWVTWLGDRYVAWSLARGGEASVERAAGRVTLHAHGGCAPLLAFERGLHVFEIDGNPLRVRVGDGDAPTRLYVIAPTVGVIDPSTGLERPGAWDEAMTGEAFDRFVLARAAG